MKLTDWMFEPIKDGDDITEHVVKAFITVIALWLIVLFLALLLASFMEPHPAIGANFLSKTETKYVLNNLKSRWTADCVLEPTEYGWKCTQQDGKVFKVRR